MAKLLRARLPADIFRRYLLRKDMFWRVFFYPELHLKMLQVGEVVPAGDICTSHVTRENCLRKELFGGNICRGHVEYVRCVLADIVSYVFTMNF